MLLWKTNSTLFSSHCLIWHSQLHFSLCIYDGIRSENTQVSAKVEITSRKQGGRFGNSRSPLTRAQRS